MNSDTQITATRPAASVGPVDITVTTPGGTSATSSSDKFTYIGIPTIISVSPTTGPVDGGTNVIITGTNFTGLGATTLFFGTNSFPATNVVVFSATQINATTPLHPLGAVNVNLTTPGGNVIKTGGYTYVAAPVFTSITPNTGGTTGNTAVTIIGTNLVGTTTVYFGTSATPATLVSVINATAVSATSPVHAAGAVNIIVLSPNGTATGVNAFTYSVPSVSITLNPTTINMPLAAGSTATNSSLGITVTTNTPFTITVRDNSAAYGRTTGYGYMGKFTGGAYDLYPALTLGSPLQLAGTTVGTTTAQAITPPITTTAKTLYTGSTSVTGQLLAPNIFSQPVVISDPHLTAGSTYRIDLTFTIQGV